MKLITNVTKGIKVLSDTFALRHYNKEINEAIAKGDEELERDCILRATRDWSTRVLNTVNVDINIIDKENLPDHGPVVLIANHQSYVDIPCVLNAVDKFQTGFIAKKVLAKLPIIGPWIKRIGGLLMNRGDVRSSLQTIKDGVELIKKGYSLVIFPEGTRAKDGVMKEFKAGSFKLAFKSGAPIVPVTIHNAYKIFEENGVVTPGTVDLVFHKPIETVGLNKHQQMEVVKDVENMIREKLEELDK